MAKPRKTRRKRVLKSKRLYRKTFKAGASKCNNVHINNKDVMVRNFGEITTYPNRELCLKDNNFTIDDDLLDKHIKFSEKFGKTYQSFSKQDKDYIRNKIKEKLIKKAKSSLYILQSQKRHAIHSELELILESLHVYIKEDFSFTSSNKGYLQHVLDNNVEKDQNFFQFKKNDLTGHNWQSEEHYTRRQTEYNNKYNKAPTPPPKPHHLKNLGVKEEKWYENINPNDPTQNEKYYFKEITYNNGKKEYYEAVYDDDLPPGVQVYSWPPSSDA